MLRQIIIHLILFMVVSMFGQHSDYFAQNVELKSNIQPGNETRYSDVWGYVDDGGNEYAILGAYGGTYFIDVTHPNDPKVVDFVHGPSSIWRDIKTHKDYAYVGTEGRGGGEGLQIIDLSFLPDSVSLVNVSKEYFRSSHNIFIDNGYLYAVGTEHEDGVHILDISDPLNPIEVGIYSESGYVHDVFVRNNLMIVCAATNYALVNINLKEYPRLITESPELPGIYAHSGWMTEDGKYFYATDEFNVRDLIVFDIGNPGKSWNIVVPEWQMNSNSTIHNVFIKNNFAHISYYGDGYVVLDISDPASPQLVGHYDTEPNAEAGYKGAWGCYPYLPSGNILISDINNGLFVLDFTLDNDYTTSVNNESALTNFELNQNYPNPFNPETKITYSVPKSSHVTLRVFNVLGQEVMTLVNSDKSPGRYSVSFNGSGLVSGIYFANLYHGGSESKSIKMILNK